MTEYYLVLEESRGARQTTRKVFEITSQEYQDIEHFMDRYSGMPTQRRNYIHDLGES